MQIFLNERKKHYHVLVFPVESKKLKKLTFPDQYDIKLRGCAGLLTRDHHLCVQVYLLSCDEMVGGASVDPRIPVSYVA